MGDEKTVCLGEIMRFLRGKRTGVGEIWCGFLEVVEKYKKLTVQKYGKGIVVNVQ